MRSRLTPAVGPAIGLLAVTGALALVATAPIVLFSPSNEAGPLPSPPAASSEVARVTAPSLRPQRSASPTTANETPEAPVETSAGGALAANTPVGQVGGATADKTAAPRTVTRRQPGSPAAEEPAAPEHPAKTKAKAKSNHNGNGKAKGHYKGKAHGKAKGHSK